MSPDLLFKHHGQAGAGWMPWHHRLQQLSNQLRVSCGIECRDMQHYFNGLSAVRALLLAAAAARAAAAAAATVASAAPAAAAVVVASTPRVLRVRLAACAAATFSVSSRLCLTTFDRLYRSLTASVSIGFAIQTMYVIEGNPYYGHAGRMLKGAL